MRISQRFCVYCLILVLVVLLHYFHLFQFSGILSSASESEKLFLPLYTGWIPSGCVNNSWCDESLATLTFYEPGSVVLSLFSELMRGTRSRLSIAYVGGSVTAGANAHVGCLSENFYSCSWKGQFEEWLSEFSPGLELEVRDLAMGGVDSLYMSYCSGLQGDEDLVFFELEPNGGWLAQPKSIEAMRRMLSPQTAVISVLTPPSIYMEQTIFPHNLTWRQAATFYSTDLFVDVHAAFSSNQCQCWEDYFAGDANHPGAKGHAAIAFFITSLIEKGLMKLSSLSTASGKALPPPIFNDTSKRLVCHVPGSNNSGVEVLKMDGWAVQDSLPSCCGRNDHKLSWVSTGINSNITFLLPNSTHKLFAYLSHGSYSYGTVVSDQGLSQDLCFAAPWWVPKGHGFNKVFPLGSWDGIHGDRHKIVLTNLQSPGPNCTHRVNIRALLLDIE